MFQHSYAITLAFQEGHSAVVYIIDVSVHNSENEFQLILMHVITLGEERDKMHRNAV